MRNNSLKLFEFGPIAKMSFKDISYLKSSGAFREQNRLCNFGRGYHEEQFSEIILNLDHWFRRRCGLNKTQLFIHNTTPYIHPRLDSRLG